MVTAKDLEKTCKFFYNVDAVLFTKMFVHFGGTENMADHLWSSKYDHHGDIGAFLGNLDNRNLKIIAKMINSWIGEETTTRKFSNVELKGRLAGW